MWTTECLCLRSDARGASSGNRGPFGRPANVRGVRVPGRIWTGTSTPWPLPHRPVRNSPNHHGCRARATFAQITVDVKGRNSRAQNPSIPWSDQLIGVCENDRVAREVGTEGNWAGRQPPRGPAREGSDRNVTTMSSISRPGCAPSPMSPGRRAAAPVAPDHVAVEGRKFSSSRTHQYHGRPAQRFCP